MDAFTADYLANLTADLTAHLITGAGRSLRRKLSGDPEQKALNRCIEAGLVALLTTASADSPAEMDLLADIFNGYFSDPDVGADVGRELEALLRGNPLDIEELGLLFEAAAMRPGPYPAWTLSRAWPRSPLPLSQPPKQSRPCRRSSRPASWSPRPGSSASYWRRCANWSRPSVKTGTAN